MADARPLCVSGSIDGALHGERWGVDGCVAWQVSLFGIGRLGICTALCLEKAGYNVLGVDINDRYVRPPAPPAPQRPPPSCAAPCC